MEAFQIHGGIPLRGTVAISGAKNAALPIMAAALLADGPVKLESVPELRDVATLECVLRELGMAVARDAGGKLHLQTLDARPVRARYRLVRRMRASFCVLGPLLARRGRAVVALPGGCNLGPRPVDLHLAAMCAMGADVQIRHGYVFASARRLHGAAVSLTGSHGPTVTGTANVLCAAVLARGTTILRGAAQEPEIVDLGSFLIDLGAKVEGLGTATIRVRGVSQLGAAAHRVIPDRIEAATLLSAAAATGGCVTIAGCRPNQLVGVLDVLSAMGARLQVAADRITLTAPGRLRAADIDCSPYPGLPTDVQSQLTVLAALARGRSHIRDRVFPERFAHVPELCRLGANISRSSAGVLVQGVDRLRGAKVAATDLRAAAALVLAGTAAEGRTIVRRLRHLDRGYERLDAKLRGLGADIERIDIRRNSRPGNPRYTHRLLHKRVGASASAAEVKTTK